MSKLDTARRQSAEKAAKLRQPLRRGCVMSDDLEREIIRRHLAAPSTPDAPAEPAPAEGEQPQPLNPSAVADRIWAGQ